MNGNRSEAMLMFVAAMLMFVAAYFLMKAW
jgi:hypothetical protein